MGAMGKAIASNARMVVRLGGLLAEGVEPKMFGARPMIDGREVVTNHPAFVYGHLAMYPSRAMEMLGLDAPTMQPPAGWAELFAAGVECRNDPQTTIYPGKDLLVTTMLDWTEQVAKALDSIDDKVLEAPITTGGRMAELFPNVGGAVNFYVSAHAMMHLGQVSTWRRCMGLGSAM